MKKVTTLISLFFFAAAVYTPSPESPFFPTLHSVYNLATAKALQKSILISRHN